MPQAVLPSKTDFLPWKVDEACPIHIKKKKKHVAAAVCGREGEMSLLQVGVIWMHQDTVQKCSCCGEVWLEYRAQNNPPFLARAESCSWVMAPKTTSKNVCGCYVKEYQPLLSSARLRDTTTDLTLCECKEEDSLTTVIYIILSV